MEYNGYLFDDNCANRACIYNGRKIGVFTGLYNTRLNGGKDYAVLSGTEIKNYDGATVAVGADCTADYTEKAQAQLNNYLTAQQEVFENILLAAEFVRVLESKGKNCDKYRKQIIELYNRYIYREQACNDLIAITQTASPNLLSPALSSIINNKSIGVVISATVCIIAAVVLTAFVSLGWYTFYNVGAEARSDCRKSKELNKILQNVDAKTKEELYNYIDEYADGFYKKAVQRTKFGATFGGIKNLVLFALGGFGVYWLLNNTSKKNND